MMATKLEALEEVLGTGANGDGGSQVRDEVKACNGYGWLRDLEGGLHDLLVVIEAREEELQSLPAPEAQAVARRWVRAASWAREQSGGLPVQGVDEGERLKIEALRDRILEIGEDAAYAEAFPESAVT